MVKICRKCQIELTTKEEKNRKHCFKCFVTTPPGQKLVAQNRIIFADNGEPIGIVRKCDADKIIAFVDNPKLQPESVEDRDSESLPSSPPNLDEQIQAIRERIERTRLRIWDIEPYCTARTAKTDGELFRKSRLERRDLRALLRKLQGDLTVLHRERLQHATPRSFVLCRDYEETGYCVRGANCPDAHISENDLERPVQMMCPTKDCPWKHEGCPYVHNAYVIMRKCVSCCTPLSWDKVRNFHSHCDDCYTEWKNHTPRCRRSGKCAFHSHFGTKGALKFVQCVSPGYHKQYFLDRHYHMHMCGKNTNPYMCDLCGYGSL